MYAPAGAGFLWKEGSSETVAREEHFAIIQYTAHGEENVSLFLEEEKALSTELEVNDSVLAFWCFTPQSVGNDVPITILIRSQSVSHYQLFVEDSIRRFE